MQPHQKYCSQKRFPLHRLATSICSAIVAGMLVLASGTALSQFPLLHAIAQSPLRPIGTSLKHKNTPIVATVVRPLPTSALKRTSRPVTQRPAALAANILDTRAALLAVVDQPTITLHHRILADRTLKSLPALCRNNLQTFSVLYKGATRRGLGGKTTIILDGNVPDDEFVALLTHECGHVIHGNLLGSLEMGLSAFKDGGDLFAADSPAAAFFAISWNNETARKEDGKDRNFASGYGKSDAFEDFAESFALYVLHRDAFHSIARVNSTMATKLTWMETNLPLAKDAVGVSAYNPSSDPPWDVTKLPFTETVL